MNKRCNGPTAAARRVLKSIEAIKRAADQLDKHADRIGRLKLPKQTDLECANRLRATAGDLRNKAALLIQPELFDLTFPELLSA